MVPSGPHDEFLELCALSAAGQLSQDEQRRLREHLAVCPSCREALQQYGSIIGHALPALAAEEMSHPDPGPSWSAAKAEDAFLRRLGQEENRRAGEAAGNEDAAGAFSPFRRKPLSPESTWRHVWILGAAGMLLVVTLGFCAYWFAVGHGSKLPPSLTNAQIEAPRQTPVSLQGSLEEQLSDAAHERQLARDEVARRDQTVADLRRQLEQQSAAMSRMKQEQEKLEEELNQGRTEKAVFTTQSGEVAHRLQAAEANSQALELQLKSVSEQSARDAAHAQTLAAKVDDLTRMLQDRQSVSNQQEQLLAHDRDIRELMGARDLYIAEVYDVGDNGATKKPFGRVFYTRGKSLIFYAYDLDQAAVKRASTFEAWGRRGPDQAEALKLGIFYEDNSAKKRWVLKLDDPKTIAQIDAVFVTLEPNPHSDKPTGKPLLFAYLKVDPNHP